MKYFLYLLTIIILTGIQIGLFHYLALFGTVPNLLLLFVIGSSLQREAEDSFFLALVGGLFLDFSSGLLIGSFALGFLLLALLLYFIIHHLVVFELSWKYLLTVTAVATVFVDACVWLFNNFAYLHNWSTVLVSGQLLRARIVPEILYNLLLAYPLYVLAIWLHNSILRLQGKKHRII